MNGPFEGFKWEAYFADWKIFGSGLLVTIEVGVIALLLALLIGIIFGVFSTSKIKILEGINRVFVEIIQNTPLVIQIFFFYNGLPRIGLTLDPTMIGILGLGIYHGAYISEVVRTGINAVHKGQLEAAYSQGFNYFEAMIYIILPQALKVILPPLTNQAVNLIKNTSILAIIAGGDLMYSSDSWASNNQYYGPAYVMTGILYFILCFPLAAFARSLEGGRKKKVK